MPLLSYAHITVAELESHIGHSADALELFSVFHDQSAGATDATVAITTNNTVTLTITGGTNAGTDVLLAASDVTALVAAINAVGKGWSATVLAGHGASNAVGTLVNFAATSAFGSAGAQFIRGTSDAGMIQAINQATELVEGYLNTRVAATDYEHVYSGTGRKVLVMRHRPVVSIDRVAINQRPAINAKNTSTDAAGATIENDGTNLILTIVGGANAGSDNVTIGANNLTTTVASINALAKGWSASVAPGADGSWLASDLFQHGARSAISDDLVLPTAEEFVEGFQVNHESGLLHRAVVTGRSVGPAQIRFRGGAQTPMDLPPLTARNTMPVWPEGYLNIYVKFRAGFETIPDDIKYATMNVAKNIMRDARRDGGMSSESVDGYSYTRMGAEDGGVLSKVFRQRIARYRKAITPVYAKVG